MTLEELAKELDYGHPQAAALCRAADAEIRAWREWWGIYTDTNPHSSPCMDVVKARAAFDAAQRESERE